MELEWKVTVCLWHFLPRCGEISGLCQAWASSSKKFIQTPSKAKVPTFWFFICSISPSTCWRLVRTQYVLVDWMNEWLKEQTSQWMNESWTALSVRIRHYQYLAYIILFNPPDIYNYPPFYRWLNWGWESLEKFIQVHAASKWQSKTFPRPFCLRTPTLKDSATTLPLSEWIPLT